MRATGYRPEVEQRLRAEAAEIIARYPQSRSALLPLLHLVQSEDSFVSATGITLCADLLGLSRAEVSAVVTFYTQYKRHPNGEYNVGVCTNALCAVMGGDIIFDSLAAYLDIGHDETTEDGMITLERLECNAACDYAPVVVVNWEFFDNQTPTSATELVDWIRAAEPITPTRGASTVATFKQISHVLAGFEDGREHEGVGAGKPTLVGLELARERGWHAPPQQAAGTPDIAGAELAGEAPVGAQQSSAEHKPQAPSDVDPTGPTGPAMPGDKATDTTDRQVPDEGTDA